MTQYPKLRPVHACHDRHSAMVMGDEPGRYRSYAHIPACENSAATNALADLFAAAPRLLALLNEADDRWGGAFASSDPIDGGDLVEWFGQWLPTVRSAIAAAQGQEAGAADEATVPDVSKSRSNPAGRVYRPNDIDGVRWPDRPWPPPPVAMRRAGFRPSGPPVPSSPFA